jgi:SM-20-related protein
MFDVLAHRNWACSDEVFSLDFCRALAQECQLLLNQGHFRSAQIGYGPSKTQDSGVRGDLIYWLDAESKDPIQMDTHQFLFELQIQLNQNFFLGLKNFESHFALYPAGASYEKHVDNPRGRGNRKMTFIIYLNENWDEGHGGELNIYSPQEETKLLAQVQPRIGTFVLFRSEMFPHQVQKSHQARMSLTGWFRDDAL